MVIFMAISASLVLVSILLVAVVIFKLKEIGEKLDEKISSGQAALLSLTEEKINEVVTQKKIEIDSKEDKRAKEALNKTIKELANENKIFCTKLDDPPITISNKYSAIFFEEKFNIKSSVKLYFGFDDSSVLHEKKLNNEKLNDQYISFDYEETLDKFKNNIDDTDNFSKAFKSHVTYKVGEFIANKLDDPIFVDEPQDFFTAYSKMSMPQLVRSKWYNNA